MNKNKKDILLVITVILLILTFISGLAFGSVKLSLKDIFLLNSNTYIIVTKLRLPRVLGALFSGFSLSTAGLLLQRVNNNDLASPTILGTNAGAGFMVMLVLCFAPQAFYLLPIAAFIGAIVAVVVVLLISSHSPTHNSKESIVLSGVAISALFNGGISFLSQLKPEVASNYIYFSSGGFNGVYLKDIIIPIIVIVISLLISYRYSEKINVLLLGDDLGSNLGVNIKKVRVICIILASVLTACSVSYAGLLGFVGLLVPHIATRLIGNDMKALMPMTFLTGGILVILADLLGRSLFAPSEVSAGVLLAFIGSPFFIYLLFRKRGH